VNRIGLALGCLVAAAAVAGSPVLAAKKATHHTVSCKEIKDAVAAGKTADEVAKDLKVSASRVKTCTTPSTKHHKTTHKAS
jgi:hypothetical protein